MLKLQFENQSGVPNNEVFITPFSPASGDKYAITFNNNQSQLTQFHSQSLEAIGEAGLDVSFVNSGVFYVSFIKKWDNTLTPNLNTTPSPVDTNDQWYRTHWDKFELTMINTDGDQGDITSIDFIGIPMQMESFANTISQQSLGYPIDNQVITKLGLKNPKAIITDDGTPTGKPVRVIGPSQYPYPSIGNWQSFGEYVQDIKSKNQSTKLKFQNARSVDKNTNWLFTYEFDAVVNENNGISMSGKITALNTISNVFSTPSDTLTVEISPDSDKGTFLSSFLYSGHPDPNNVVFCGNWEGFFADKFPLEKADGQARLIGDLSTGFAYGFVGSWVKNPATGNFFKDDSSLNWFAKTQTLALTELQPDKPFYSEFENIIFQESKATVYGYPYSDRLQKYAVAVNVVKNNGTPIDTLKITILKP